ncbi:MAG: hypothetical protein WEB30_13730 [Cyclobacteriaceae bacterium]
MADERDLELLDDYLTNRMSEQDRRAFEQKLQADPDLQHEYALQNRLIKGIKDVRVAELKAMLNNVPVPANGPGNALATKILLGTVVTLMVTAVAYLYISRDDIQMAEPVIPTEQEQDIKDEPVSPRAEDQTIPEEERETVQEQTTQDKNQTSAGTEHRKPSLAGKPDPLKAPEKKSEEQAPEPVLDIFDPGAQDSTPGTDIGKEKQPAYTPGKSTLLVEADLENTRYKFHYQFREGKLFLYGPFEQNLYEIMEFFAGEKRTVFLYYRDHYYRLEEADSKIRPLDPITDPALLKKLKEYRSSK